MILDAFVASWLDREAAWKVDPVPWSLEVYRGYLDAMHAWASDLGVEPDELEMCIFRA